ncbi:MAG TPA: 16S rRNA (guanine(527)-N(7))-methyltransferase RsmG [Halioglobus sp.]
MEPQLTVKLQQGCNDLKLPVDAGGQQRLLDYLELLSKWNGTYNLTAVRDKAQMVTRHLLDSLAIAPYLTGQRFIDVGTGAGLPGVPLAIVFPEREFHLLDSNGKKTRFLFQVKTALGLDNMIVHLARVESFRAASPFDMVLSRAFASLQDMVHGCRHLLAPGGCFLAMKGAHPMPELDAVSQECAEVAVYPLTVPGLDEQRHLVKIELRQSSRRA